MTSNKLSTPKNQKPEFEVSKKTRRVITVAIVTIIIVLALNFFTGIFSYAFTYARCMRQPVAASRFAADYHYYVPGQQGYGVNGLMEYYCNEQEAAKAGFNKSSW